MSTWRAILPGNKEHYVTFAVQAETPDAARSKLEAKMLKSGFYGTVKLWKAAGQKVVAQ